MDQKIGDPDFCLPGYNELSGISELDSNSEVQDILAPDSDTVEQEGILSPDSNTEVQDEIIPDSNTEEAQEVIVTKVKNILEILKIEKGIFQK